jgi:hypothetical protein
MLSMRSVISSRSYERMRQIENAAAVAGGEEGAILREKGLPLGELGEAIVDHAYLLVLGR